METQHDAVLNIDNPGTKLTKIEITTAKLTLSNYAPYNF